MSDIVNSPGSASPTKSVGFGFSFSGSPTGHKPSSRKSTVSFIKEPHARKKFGSMSVKPAGNGEVDGQESTLQINAKIPEIFEEESFAMSAEENDVFAPWAASEGSGSGIAETVGKDPVKGVEHPANQSEENPPPLVEPPKKSFQWKQVLEEKDDFTIVPMAPRTIGIVSFIARFPLIVMILSLAVPVYFLYLAVTQPSSFSTNIADFRAIRHPTVQSHQSFEAAVEEWSALQERRDIVHADRTIPKYRLFLQFSARDNFWEYGVEKNRTNLLTEDSLRFVQEVEQLAYTAEYFRILCWTNNQKLGQLRPSFPECVPFSSLSTYFFPGGLRKTSSGFVEFALNGLGSVLQQPIYRVLQTILQNERYRWFVDPGFSQSRPESSVLRSQITLGFPVLNNGTEITLSHYNALVDLYIADLVKKIETVNHPNISVTLGGDRVVDALIGDVLYTDILYAAIGIAIALLFMVYHMRSLFLGSCAVVQMTLVYIASYYVFTQATTRFEMSLITGITIVVTFSFSSHGILVIHETFVHSGMWANTGRKTMWTLEQRMAYVFRKGISGTFVSSLCAIAAFGCDALSPVPAMKDFSLMVILNIVFTIYFSITFFPAAISFYQWHFCRRTHPLIRQKNPAYAPKQFKRSEKMTKFLESEEATKILYDEPTFKVMTQVAHGRKSVIPSAKSIMRDPVKRRMSMMNMSMSQTAFSPSKSTFVSNRMVPLACIFQINPQLMVPATGRQTVRSAVQSYTRRIVAEKGSVLDEKVPAYVEDGVIKNDVVVTDVTTHRTKWEYVGRMIGTLRADEFSPFITEQLSNAIRGETTVWNDRRSYFLEDYTEIDCPEQKQLSQIVAGGCFGLFGERRRGLTREEKDSRILNVKHLHQGYTKAERFFLNNFAPLVRRMRYVMVVFGLATGLIMLIFATQFQEMSGDPLVIDKYSSVNGFEVVRDRFAGQGNCDYCGAYQRKVSEFPQFSLNSLQQCILSGFGLQMHAEIDRCGQCLGNNECIDCADRPFGGLTIDQCGLCTGAGSEYADDCLKCDLNPTTTNISCSYCKKKYNLTYGGYNCTSFCDDISCPPDRGICNQWTGQCECFGSFSQGFFANDPPDTKLNPPMFCTTCLPGFSPLPGEGINPCTVECDSSSSCDCVGGRCANCSIHQLGPDCAIKNLSSCRLGTVLSDGSCDCPPEYESVRCYGHQNCSYNGYLQPAVESPSMTEECRCFGQWLGPSCNKCKCYNGGSCDSVTGDCICVGGWGGFDCSQCLTNCLKRGFCPHPFSHMNYDETTCEAIYCNSSFLEAGIPCPECDRRNETLCFNQTNTTCHPTKCNWDSDNEICSSKWEIVEPHPTQVNCTGCVGEWSGASCEYCSGEQWGLACDSRGVIIGCDGVPTPYGFPVRITDSCSVCNGPNLCLGCDSVLGSRLQLDQCGVCGGENECLNGETLTVSADFVWGLFPATDDRNGSFLLSTSVSRIDFDRADFQQFLYATCLDLIFNKTSLIVPQKSRCVWLDFADWLRNETATAPFQEKVSAAIQFPFLSANKRDIHYLLYSFASTNNYFSDVGFSSVDDNATDLRALWIKVRLTTTTPASASSAEHLATYSDLEALRLEISNDNRNSGNILHSSTYWSLAISRQSGTQVVLYSVFSSSLVFVVGTIVTSSQPFLTGLALVCNFAVMVASLFIFYFLSWELGPVEQLAFSMSVAFSSEYVVHLVIGYTEYLTGPTTVCISRDVLRYQSVRTALLRVATSIFTSVICSVAVACTIVTSPIRLFSRIGIILIATHSMAIMYAFIFFVAVVCISGPVVVRRFSHDRLLTFLGSLVVLGVALLSVALAGRLEINVSAGSILL